MDNASAIIAEPAKPGPKIAIYSPLHLQPFLQGQRKSKNIHIKPGNEIEKTCCKCKETWPADTEFFHATPSKKSGLCDWCRACYAEWRQTYREKKAQK